MPYGLIGNIAQYTPSSKTSVADTTVMQTLDNIIMFSRGMTVNTAIVSGDVLITFPDNTWAPSNRTTIYVPVRETINGSSVYSQKRLWIETNGTITAAESIQPGVIYLQSLMYNVNGRYYNESVNNTTGFTSPLNAR